MATKTVAWNSGSGVITLTYTGQGNGSVSVKSDTNDSFDERSQNLNIVTTEGSPEKAVQVLVKQAGKPLGWTTKDFGYTGSVQELTLPKGRYKLQCWGAQGGSVTGTYAATGSKGGYSEGIITLTETTTLYIFVGGQGTSYTSSASQTSTTVLNGGWNGGGAGVRTSLYNSSNINGRSFPRGGGGATDIALVTSSMSYSSGRTNRSSESLLSRIIVAGGGAGASARYTEETVTVTSTEEVRIDGFSSPNQSISYNEEYNRTFYFFDLPSLISAGDVLTFKNWPEYMAQVVLLYYTADGTAKSVYNTKSRPNITVPADYDSLRRWQVRFDADTREIYTYDDLSNSIEIYKVEEKTTTNVNKSDSRTTGSQQGGGTKGLGYFGGVQSAGYGGGTFGLGANQTSTNYRYAAGGGGGGWYGGGTGPSDTDTSVLDKAGGGSGFVNTAANASYRPNGYTGLQLDSGSTIAGNSSHPSVSGGTEVGHSGNGYARITVIN